jgi:hypothetical protein
MSMALALRLFLATLFARAAWHKMSQSQSFRAELSAYKLLPEFLIVPATYVLVATEIFCTAGILFSNIAIEAAITLLLLYGAAIDINLWRGNRNIDCGCGGWLSPRKTLSGALVIRNLLLALLAFICLLLPAPANLSTGDMLLALLIAFVLWLLYEAIEQAMGNFQHYQQWKKQSSQTGSTQ